MKRSVLALLACPALALPGAPAMAEVGEEKVRGVVISTHTSGHEWALDVMGGTIEDIRAVGANWVATHPYAAIRADGTVAFRDFDPASPPAYLVRPIREAHARGLKIAIKPHLAYWGSPFGWRGEIEFGQDDAWERFWSSYERWIVAVAAACREADGFIVGTELDRTLHHEARWRRIVRRVREVTDAPLTYAANWTDYERVPFWDALDAIGIQGYFPLTQRRGPERPEIEQAWAARLAQLRRFSERHRRRIVFTELGYNRSFDAAAEPWAYRSDGTEAEGFQALLMEIALSAIEREPAIAGVFLWKWFPNPRPVGRNFQLATSRLKRVIADVWIGGR